MRQEEIAPRVVGFAERLARVQAKREAVDKELTAIYKEASESSIDVYALKAAMACRFSKDSDIASIYWLLCKHMRSRHRPAHGSYPSPADIPLPEGILQR